MKELSVFVDESGELGKESKYYLITLLFHDQDLDISSNIALYESSLRERGLNNIPFHMSPLMRGHADYSDLDIQTRQRLLAGFFVFARNLPISYRTFAYRKSEFDNRGTMLARMRRDVTVFLFDASDRLQEFDKVKVYYDDGQPAMGKMLHDAIEYTLSRNVLMFKNASPAEYRLSQVADFICGIELAAIKYESKENAVTEYAFFGGSTAFKKNFLKKVRKHRIS